MTEECGLPPTAAGLLRILQSEPFCLLLSHLTGLDLAQGVIRSHLEHSPSSALPNGGPPGDALEIYSTRTIDDSLVTFYGTLKSV